MASRWPRVDLVGAAGEREILEAFLDDYRAAIVRKATGVSDEDARARLVRSATTLGGVVKHLRWVEHAWFQTGLAQRPADELPPRPSREDEFRLGPGETLAGVIEEYETECAQSRETAARYALDDTFPDEDLGRCSLHWLYIHMIEETARHAGHIDILREQLDGTVGD